MEPVVAQLPVSHRLRVWFEANKKPALWGASILTLAILVIWYVVYQRDQKEIAASEALSNVALTPPRGTASQPDLAGAYLKIAATYPDSSAGARALLLAAGDLFSQGKFEEATTQFQRFTHDHHDSPLMGEALLGIAACLDAQNKTSEAAAAYKDLIERHPTASFISQARIALGRLYEAQNKPELALNCFEEAAQADPYGSIGAEAGMKAEELKIKYPALAPKAPAPAASMPMISAQPASAAPIAQPAPMQSSRKATNSAAPKAGASK